MKVKINTITREVTSTVIAFCTTSDGIILLDISTFSLCLKPLTTVAHNTDSVVVLMPPPVEPGQAPININMIIKKSVAEENLEISQVLKPAVLEVID